MLAAVSGAFAQAEPTPVATPSDVPTATVSPAQPSPTAEPAKAAATPCPECGMTADQCKDEKPAAKPAEDVDGTLRGLEQEYAEAIKANDVAFVQRVVSEDCTNVGPDGGIAYKADLLTVLRSGLLKVESFTYNDMKVRVYGETAVVTGECVVKGPSRPCGCERSLPLDGRVRETRRPVAGRR